MTQITVSLLRSLNVLLIFSPIIFSWESITRNLFPQETTKRLPPLRNIEFKKVSRPGFHKLTHMLIVLNKQLTPIGFKIIIPNIGLDLANHLITSESG